jgi:hypothetical protein
MSVSAYSEHLTQTFQEDVARYPSLKQRIERLKNRVLGNPYHYSDGLEQGKWLNLKGLRSVHMMAGKYVFLIAICEDCIRNGHLKMNLERCGDICTQEALKRVVFFAFGTHDSTYGKL